MTEQQKIKLIEHFCLKNDLRSYDPYDIWKTKLGFWVKNLFNKNKYLGLIPAAILTLIDLFFKRIIKKLCYKKQEYPIVRAQASLALMELYKLKPNQDYLDYAKKHISWLLNNFSNGYSGLCWGLGFKWPADSSLIYSSNTPFTTHTPYVLEAIHEYYKLTGDETYIQYIKSIYKYYENDVEVVYETEKSLGISYGPMKDRLIMNAVSYTLYAYTIFYEYIDENKSMITNKIDKLYSFIMENQLKNGEWLYEPFNDKTFIDCFHSCFVVKNVIKANELYNLPNFENIVERAYNYIFNNFLNEEVMMVSRFSKKNKPSVVKYDLYDNSEFLSLANQKGDMVTVEKMLDSITANFNKKNRVYSMIDVFGFKRNVNMLRWATMPMLLSFSKTIK